MAMSPLKALRRLGNGRGSAARFPLAILVFALFLCLPFNPTFRRLSNIMQRLKDVQSSVNYVDPLVVEPDSIRPTFATPAVDLQNLPQWVQDYLEWHRQQRAKFPGLTLFKHPQAPKLLIRKCYLRCGGLHDRLGYLPWDLYLANQTKRVLLIHWCNEKLPIQEFLVPRKISEDTKNVNTNSSRSSFIVDWRIPNFIIRSMNSTSACTRTMKRYTNMFPGDDDTPYKRWFFDTNLDTAEERATVGQFASERILTFEILASNQLLQKRLQALHETDFFQPYLSESSSRSSFGTLFWSFFQPSVGLQSALDAVMQDNQLHPIGRPYSAAHCRVRHPRGLPTDVKVVEKGEISPDFSGILWEDESSRNYAIKVATNAVECLRRIIDDDNHRKSWGGRRNDTEGSAHENHLHHGYGITSLIASSNEESVYFSSDSEDLVQYMATSEVYYKLNANITQNAYNATPTSIRILSRNVSQPTLHIDNQWDVGHSASSFYDSFVDLFIASQARCLSVGVGNYGKFAAKLSGTSCLTIHRPYAGTTDDTGGDFDGHYLCSESHQERKPS